MLLYYITDRSQFPGNELERTSRLLDCIAEATAAGVDFIQLREKDLPTRLLESLAHAALEKTRAWQGKTRLLINSRTDVALAGSADGVHLRSRDVSPPEVRSIWHLAGANNDPIISVSCHTESEVVAAKTNGADFAVFAPVFEKRDASASPTSPKNGRSRAPAGIDALRSACRHQFPVLALGGVTAQNANLCIHAGAAGIAGIRLFQEGDLAETVKRLRG